MINNCVVKHNKSGQKRTERGKNHKKKRGLWGDKRGTSRITGPPDPITRREGAKNEKAIRRIRIVGSGVGSKL